MTNFDTVREALELATPHYQADTARFAAALKALTAIEAEHFTPGDMADAQAKAFREGVASVQPALNRFHHLMHDHGLHPGRTDDDLLEILDAHLTKVASVQQGEPVAWMVTTELQDGIRSTYPLSGRYKDVRVACDFGEPVPLYAAPVAQQPNFADAYQGAMGEVAIWKRRALEAEEVNRRFVAEINGPTHMGEPVAQQPQAKPHKPLFADLIAQHPGLREELKAMDKQPQAEAKRQYDLAHRLRVHLANRHTLTSPEFKDGVEAILAEYYAAAPQQAEAVPPDVVRDAERWRTFLATRPANTHAVINAAIDAAMAQGAKT